jgi:UDP-N-acetylmuramyl pentapeptide phosphotransferase/UDP-N-acetylglucosamine-1-phosphate transferase
MAVNVLRSALAGAGVALACTPLAAEAAKRTGMMDRPGPLKPQTRAVPYLGGLAVTAGLAAGTSLGNAPVLLVPPAFAMALGLADDRLNLPIPLRVAGEVAIGVGVALASNAGRNPLLWALAVGGTVGTINGVNLLDGLDGLASTVVSVAASGFALLTAGQGRVLGASLAGALGGFLAFNRPPARIYLGDAGSYLLGTGLASLLVLTWGADSANAPAALALLSYPCGELLCSVVRRWRAERPLLQGDRDHTYDRLVKRGWSPGSVSLLCGAGQAALVGVALGLSVLPRRWAWVGVGALGAVLGEGAMRAGLLKP